MNKQFELCTNPESGICQANQALSTNNTRGITENGKMKAGSLKKLSLLLFFLGAALTVSPEVQAQQQSTVYLGSAGSYAVLAGTTVTNTGNSIVNGNLGVWPGTAVTGFGPGKVNGTEDAGDAAAQHAQASLDIAFKDAAGRTSVNINNIAGDLSGRVLAPGLYKSTSTLSLTGTVSLSGKGVYIFQIASGLTVGNGGTVVLSGGADSANVFWQVGSSATLGTTADFKGTILALTSISLATNAKLDGRALAQHGAVTLDTTSVTLPLTNAVLIVLPPAPPNRD